MPEIPDMLALLAELETMDRREAQILDALQQVGAAMERPQDQVATNGDLLALGEALDRVAAAIAEVKDRIGPAHAAPSTNGSAPNVEALGQPRTFRLTNPPMRGDDVKAFQRLINLRFEAWHIDKRIREHGTYDLDTRQAARQVAVGLGVATADYAHGITPQLRGLIRTPSRRTAEQVARAKTRREWLGKLRGAHARKKPPSQPARAPAPAPLAPDLATAIRAGKGRYEDVIIREAGRSKLPVSLVCAVIEQESAFRNVFGHDAVRNPIKSPPHGLLEVTEARYRKYLQHRRLGQGSQGVGPMQLTWPAFQDRADSLGGCWRPEVNIRVGVEVLADNIKRLGLARGVQAYNGAPGNGYATSVLGLERKWRALLGHAHAHAQASATTPHDEPATLRVLHRGARSESARALQAATKRRLSARHLGDVAESVVEDGVVGPKTMSAVTTAAWLLGAQRTTLHEMNGSGQIPVGVQRMIRNPGRRTAAQKALGKRRVAHALVARKRRAAVAAKTGGPRKRVVKLAKQAAANYRANPGAYHYRAGGKANTVFLEPTPSDWRSDCSQFVASVYKKAGLPSPANVAHEWASTYSMVKKGRVTHSPRPGDLGMYGSLAAPHHVELYCGEPGQEFIGHGSPPIDSRTPGRPDYYLTYDFLD